MTELIFKKEAEIYKALAHPVRLEILKLLVLKNLGVDRLSELLHKRQPNISQHLKVLKKVGLVLVSKKGKRRIYHLDSKWIIILKHISKNTE